MISTHVSYKLLFVTTVDNTYSASHNKLLYLLHAIELLVRTEKNYRLDLH